MQSTFMNQFGFEFLGHVEKIDSYMRNMLFSKMLSRENYKNCTRK